MKKLLCLAFTVLFLLSETAFVPITAAANSASSYCVIDAMTGRVLYEKNAREKRGMASTTKIMTAIVALERANPSDMASVSYNASRTEGSSLYLKPSEKMSITDLVYGLMLNSGNDAAVVLAEHIGGSVEGFAAMMNETAKKICANSTNFTNPNGLYDEKHYTTAYDLALIARYAMKNETFAQIVSTKKYTAHAVSASGERNIYLSNHNKLLSMLEGCDGVKTGFTKKTGRCLVSSATRKGQRIICVTLNAPDDWNDHTSLINTAFSEYKMRRLISAGQYIRTVPVQGGIADSVGVVAAEDIYVPAKENETLDFELVYDIAQQIDAPISQGQDAGKVEVVYNGESVTQAKLITAANVEISDKKNVTNLLFEFCAKFLKLAILIILYT